MNDADTDLKQLRKITDKSKAKEKDIEDIAKKVKEGILERHEVRAFEELHERGVEYAKANGLKEEDVVKMIHKKRGTKTDDNI